MVNMVGFAEPVTLILMTIAANYLFDNIINTNYTLLLGL